MRKTHLCAGHEFPDTMDAVCIKPLPNGDSCPVSWPSIANTTREQVNEQGIAHVSYMTLSEYEEIEKLRAYWEEVKERAYRATQAISG